MKAMRLIAMPALAALVLAGCGDGGESATVLTFSNGGRYVGEVRDGLPHGEGVMTWADGSRYEGEWQREGERLRRSHVGARG